ncbi:response regulator [Oligoflexus tunisiensis]|uniref:response regulator n=1 Tax=Oligoflexus tunisiensis TaxID=708132 RepID=UPI00114C8F0A|nr:response regulator [Oligoflexus tunisiensis]
MTTDNLPPKILIMDSDRTVLGPLIEPFSKMKVEIFAAHDLETAMYRFNKQFFKVVLVEQQFPELDGVAIIQRLRQHPVREKALASFVMVTNNSGMTKEQMALLEELGQIQTVGKPLAWGPLVSIAQKAFRQAVKRELIDKMRTDIVSEMNGTFEFNRVNEKLDDLKNALEEEYIPLKLELYEKSKNYREALQFIQSLDPGKIDSLRRLNMLGRLYLKLGRLEDAQKAFEEADQQAPRNLERVTQMVDLYLQMRIPEQAIEKGKEIIEFNPDRPEIKFDLFKKLEDNGFSDEAVAFCRDTTSPQEVVTYFNNKGVVLAQTEHLPEAITEYGRALNYYPKHKSVHAIHFNLALAMLKSKNPKSVAQAIRHLEIALELNPNYEKAQHMLEKLKKVQRSA